MNNKGHEGHEEDYFSRSSLCPLCLWLLVQFFVVGGLLGTALRQLLKIKIASWIWLFSCSEELLGARTQNDTDTDPDTERDTTTAKKYLVQSNSETPAVTAKFNF